MASLFYSESKSILGVMMEHCLTENALIDKLYQHIVHYR